MQLRGVRPFLSDKYDITKHPNYKYLSDFDWSYVKKKYKLNMPFLRLAYPAKASAFSSNAA